MLPACTCGLDLPLEQSGRVGLAAADAAVRLVRRGWRVWRCGTRTAGSTGWSSRGSGAAATGCGSTRRTAACAACWRRGARVAAGLVEELVVAGCGGGGRRARAARVVGCGACSGRTSSSARRWRSTLGSSRRRRCARQGARARRAGCGVGDGLRGGGRAARPAWRVHCRVDGRERLRQKFIRFERRFGPLS